MSANLHVRTSQIPHGFDKDIFINCPFDNKFLPLFKAIIFAVHDLGFRPRCALETSNAGQNRIDKIQKIIADCKYSIHDLSRTDLDPINHLPRFNMPLELGMDLGCKKFGSWYQNEKVLLVMDIKQYRYQKFISDIAGQDVYAHGGNEKRAIRVIREWLRNEIDSKRYVIPGGNELCQRYQRFKKDFPAVCLELGWDSDHPSFLDFSDITARWVEAHPLESADILTKQPRLNAISGSAEVDFLPATMQKRTPIPAALTRNKRKSLNITSM